MRYFITGSAGFIGFHLALRLLESGHDVRGFDGLTSYYDTKLKKERGSILETYPRFTYRRAMLEERDLLCAEVAQFRPNVIIHLAAQAGVRLASQHFSTYVNSNLVGCFNLLEAARETTPTHLLIASSSTVYGNLERLPFREVDRTDSPMSFYASTKKASEVLSHAYANEFGIPTTCLRFFTAFGPWGRPDMALFKFVDAVENGFPIDVYGADTTSRDFTYIDDVVESIIRLTAAVPRVGHPVAIQIAQDSLSEVAPWRAVNVASGTSVTLGSLIALIEEMTGKLATTRVLPQRRSEMTAAQGSLQLLAALTGPVSRTNVRYGVNAFIRWYRSWREGRNHGR